MKHLARVTVTGLFDSFDHSIEIVGDPEATIISGPNGTGKTHILRLLKATFELDLDYLTAAPFRRMMLAFKDESELAIVRNLRKGEPVGLDITGAYPSGRTYSYTFEPIPERDREFTFLERRLLELTGEWDSEARAFSAKNPIERNRKKRYPAWLSRMAATPTHMIETKRLHIPAAGATARRSAGGKEPSALETHIKQIDSQVSAAREKSLSVTQELDQTFPMRILGNRNDSPNSYRRTSLSRLSAMYEEVQEIGAELHSIGLSAMPELIEIPGADVTDIERKILTLFAQDWRRKLEPLLPIGERLSAFTSILNGKLRGKKVNYHPTRGLEFTNIVAQEVIPVDSLSSGEQHLLVLFASLLFSAPEGSIVLIDEPEISMHAAWKHAFLEDITLVGRIQNLQVILATHSTSIIRGRWDLVQEIGLKDD